MDSTIEGGDDTGGIDPEDFARRVRGFALDAHRILSRPDGPIDEAIELHRRAWSLSQEVSEARMTDLHRWLVAARREIATRLHRWAAEELESLVA
jgi:hypothetical protein